MSPGCDFVQDVRWAATFVFVEIVVVVVADEGIRVLMRRSKSRPPVPKGAPSRVTRTSGEERSRYRSRTPRSMCPTSPDSMIAFASCSALTVTTSEALEARQSSLSEAPAVPDDDRALMFRLNDVTGVAGSWSPRKERLQTGRFQDNDDRQLSCFASTRLASIRQLDLDLGDKTRQSWISRFTVGLSAPRSSRIERSSSSIGTDITVRTFLKHPLIPPQAWEHRDMSTAVATKRRRWKLQDASTLRDPTSDASSSRLSNRQANLPELFALRTMQPPNADQDYKRRCDVAAYATQTPDLGAFQTIAFLAVSHRRIGVGKIGAPPLLSTNYENSEREKCNASLYDVFTGEDRVIVVEKPEWKVPRESDTVVRNASGVLPENGWPRDLLVPTGTGMIGPEIYDLVIDYRFFRQARKIPQGVLAAVTLRSRSEILLEVRIFRGSYQHSDGEEYDCLDRSRPCSKDTDRTYPEAGDDGTLRTAPWSSRCGCVKEASLTRRHAQQTMEQTCNARTFGLQEGDYFFAEAVI
ncbi:hypothetical protein MRX96_040455 [Rhipicephalus microplus]